MNAWIKVFDHLVVVLSLVNVPRGAELTRLKPHIPVILLYFLSLTIHTH